MKDHPPLDYGSPFMTWDQLPKEVRAEVVRLAGAGQFHPDWRVRRLAYTWAAPTAKEPIWSIGLWAAMSLGDGSYDLFGALRNRRQARAIVALGDPEVSER